VRVMLLSRPGDVASDQARLYLVSHDVDFVERAVDEQPQARPLVAPRLAAPLVLIGSEAVIGFDAERLERLLQPEACSRRSGRRASRPGAARRSAHPRAPRPVSTN